MYILYGFLYSERANSWGRFWCDACNSVNRTCSTSTLVTLATDVQSGESEEEEVMGEGIGEHEMEELVPE